MKEFFQKIKDQLKNIIIGVLVVALIVLGVTWIVKNKKLNKELQQIRIDNVLLKGQWTQAEVIIAGQTSVISAKDDSLKKLIDLVKSGGYLAGQLNITIDSLKNKLAITTKDTTDINKSFTVDFPPYVKISYLDLPKPQKDSVMYTLYPVPLKVRIFMQNYKFNAKAVDLRNNTNVKIDSLIVEIKEGGKFGYGATFGGFNKAWCVGPAVNYTKNRSEYQLSPIYGRLKDENLYGCLLTYIRKQ